MKMPWIMYPLAQVTRSLTIKHSRKLITHNFVDAYSVKIENGSFRWSSEADDPLILKK